MAKRRQSVTPSDESVVVEELHPVEGDVEYEDVTGKDNLPEGVSGLEATDEVEEIEQEPAPVRDDMPGELKGKSPEELARMYLSAQSVIGRQGSELGDLRKVADTYLQAHLLEAARQKQAPAVKAAEKQPDEVDFFSDPRNAIAKEIANHPALKQLQGEARQLAADQIARRRRDAEVEFTTTHPDAKDVLADPDFRDWIVASPIRKQLLLRAHQQYDLTSANEVFNTWKALKGARQIKEQPGTKRVLAAKVPGKVPTGGNANPRQAGGKSQKIYRRADVIRLMESDPDRYNSMADEITQAYVEGRVR